MFFNSLLVKIVLPLVARWINMTKMPTVACYLSEHYNSSLIKVISSSFRENYSERNYLIQVLLVMCPTLSQSQELSFTATSLRSSRIMLFNSLATDLPITMCMLAI